MRNLYTGMRIFRACGAFHSCDSCNSTSLVAKIRPTSPSDPLHIGIVPACHRMSVHVPTMQCYKELTVPTAVTHSLSLPFLSPSANNLVIAKSSLLQIFSFKSIISQNTQTGPNDQTPTSATIRSFDRLSTTKLVLVAQYELSGTITSLARVKILKSKSGADALLVALKDAKLSLVEWDPERFGISTISIHYYEGDNVSRSPWEPDLSQCVNHLTVDPSSRCAAFKFGTRSLAILPFHQAGDDLVMADEYDPELDEEKPERRLTGEEKVDQEGKQTPYAASFVLSLLALDPALTHPIHLQFLYEYREPTLGILYSQGASSSALLHERKDIVSYAVYTIDIEQRASTTLLSVNKLPYDLHTIVPLSRIVGGVLIVGCNELIYVDQSGKATGVAVNELAKLSTSFALTDQSHLSMKLEGSVIKQLGSDNPDLLMVLESGELAIVSFKIDGRSVSGVSVRRVEDGKEGNALSTFPSCAALVGRGRIFVGSEEGNSVVLGWSRGTDKVKRRPPTMEDAVEQDNAFMELEEQDFEDDDDLYSGEKPSGEAKEALNGADEGQADYVFRVHDSMLNLAPLKDVAIANPNNLDMSNSKGGYEFISTCGHDRGGGLIQFQQEIAVKSLHRYGLTNATSAWALRAAKSSNNTPIWANSDQHVIASVTSDSVEKSRIFSISKTDLVEKTDTDFDPDAGRTLEVGSLNDGTRIIQVLGAEIRTYDVGEYSLLPLAAFCLPPLAASTQYHLSLRGLSFTFTAFESFHLATSWLGGVARPICNTRAHDRGLHVRVDGGNAIHVPKTSYSLNERTFPILVGLFYVSHPL